MELRQTFEKEIKRPYSELEYVEYLEKRLEKVEEEKKEAVEIIQWLREVQNGCPLPKYEDSFNNANKMADRFIKNNQE